MKSAVYGFLVVSSMALFAHGSVAPDTISANAPKKENILQDKIATSVTGEEKYIGPRVSKSFEECHYTLSSGANDELKVEVAASSDNHHLGAQTGIDIFGIEKRDLPLKNGFRRHVQRLPYGHDAIVSYNHGVLTIESKNTYESYGAQMNGTNKAEFHVSADLKEIKSAKGNTSLTVNGAPNLSSQFSCKF
jgi:hypothetical protein